ncbi:MAG: adenylate/guanylate cyclase domain-containing protein [Candidatus Hodarchaeota archaeon]
MKCPKCQHENPEDSKFCLECGKKLELRCPHCDKTLPIGAKFCNECGHSLALPSEPPPKELSFDEKIAKIQRYLPKGVTEKILSQRDRIEGERKQVTVMFCDMEGFTALSEKLGPEEAYSIMDQVYEILIHKVHDYEGTVNEMTGDGIMALFGAPIALEDAPQRAIRSAYAIHREMTKFSDQLRAERGLPPVKMRIGIHTGPVVVGTLGNDLRVEFKAVGDTVNLASRVEGLAQPGSTYVTQDTFKLTEGLFRFEALGEKEIKGKEEPVRVYRVIAPSTRRTRFDVSADRGLTPFVGRERELEILLDGLEWAKEGRGQAVSLVAEAGVGKSRLLYEFRKAIANEDVTFLEGKCLSYSRSVAYYPITDILKANFDIREGDGDSEIRKKIRKRLEILKTDEASTLPYLLELFSVKESGIDKFPTSPEERKDRIMEAVKRITFKGPEIRPLILAYEDIHWIDKNSEDLLKNVLENIPGARILMIFTYRPEFVHTWGGRSYHSQVTLNRLSNRESLAMATHLLGSEEIARDLEDLILEKTEGVPFFIEEFIKSLKDLNIIEKKNGTYHLAKDMQVVSIPTTIQDVIMARVDSLPEGAKGLLQTGSVIEREFSYELIKRVASMAQEELLSHLSALKDSELLYERGIYPEATYIFKHALTREVLYDSILTKRKMKLHGQIGNAIEELYKDNLDEYYGILAHHFIIGENFEKGAKYSQLAGKKAEKDASFNDAVAYGEKRISCLEKLPVADDVQKKIIDARTTLGLYLSQMGNLVSAKEAIDPIIDVAMKSGYKRRLSQIYTLIGIYYIWVKTDIPKAVDHLEESLRIAEEIGNQASLLFANFWLGTALGENCELEKAAYHVNKALEINVAANSLWGIVVMKSYLGGYFYNHRGRVDMGFQTTHEALRIAEESNDIYSKTWAYNYHGWSCYYKGLLEEAIVHLLKGAEFCEKINAFRQNFETHRALAFCYLDIGDYEKSKFNSNNAITIAEHARYCLDEIYSTNIVLATAKVMNNERGVHLESLYGYATENKLRINDGWMRRYIGEILLNIDDKHLPEAEDWTKKAIEADKRNGMMWHLGRDYALYAELFRRKGDLAKAKQNLDKAIEILKECGADGWVEKYEKKLAALS